MMWASGNQVYAVQLIKACQEDKACFLGTSDSESWFIFNIPAVLKLKVGSGALPAAAAEEAAKVTAPVPGVLLGGPHMKTPAK